VSVAGVSGLRLIGLIGQGSTPWIDAGSIALLIFVLGFIRGGGVALSDHANHRGEASMNKAPMTLLRVVGYGMLNTVWAIGTNAMAAPLSA
jgi:hypothetical protein